MILCAEDTTGIASFVVAPTFPSAPAPNKGWFSVNASRRDCSRAFDRYLQVEYFNPEKFRRLRGMNDCLKMRKKFAMQSSTVQRLVRRLNATIEPDLNTIVRISWCKAEYRCQGYYSPTSYYQIKKYLKWYSPIEFFFY